MHGLEASIATSSISDTATQDRTLSYDTGPS